MKKSAIIILAAVLLFFSCAADKGGGITLEYARWGTPDEVTSTRKITRMFEKANPGIKVKVTAEPWGGYWNKLQAQLAAGGGPDVFLIGASYVHDFMTRGVLLDISTYIENDSGFNRNDYYQSPFEIFEKDGRLYALPRDINAIVMFYNKDLFDRAGVDYPTDDWTWKDYLAKAKKLTADIDRDGTIDQWGTYVQNDYEVYFGNFIYQNGARPLNKAGTASAFNDPAVIEAFQFLQDLMHLHKVAPSSAAQESMGQNVFGSGKVAMVSDGTWRFSAYQNVSFNWDIAMLPRKKEHGCIANGVANAINSKTAQAQAAWKLVKFLSGEEAQKRLAASGTSIPIMKKVAESDKFLNGRPANKIAALKSLEYGHNYPVTPGMSEWLYSALLTESQNIFLNEKTPREGMASAHKEINRILKEHQK